MRMNKDAAKIGRQWAAAATFLQFAADRWRTVSPDTTGPVEELLRDALWNRDYFAFRAAGSTDAKAQACAERAHGRPEGRYVVYDPQSEQYLDSGVYEPYEHHRGAEQEGR